jgi:hypothetical protein
MQDIGLDEVHRLGDQITSERLPWQRTSENQKYAVHISMSPVRQRLIGLWNPRPDCCASHDTPSTLSSNLLTAGHLIGSPKGPTAIVSFNAQYMLVIVYMVRPVHCNQCRGCSPPSAPLVRSKGDPSYWSLFMFIMSCTVRGTSGRTEKGYGRVPSGPNPKVPRPSV